MNAMPPTTSLRDVWNGQSDPERANAPRAQDPLLKLAMPMKPPHWAFPLLSVGVILIFGGEAFCILGPLRYERAVHIACHAIFYLGIVLVALGIVLHWRERPLV